MPVYKKTLITDPKYIAGLSETQKTQLSQSEKAKETFISNIFDLKWDLRLSDTIIAALFLHLSL